MNSNWKSNILRFLSAQTISLFGSSIVQYAIIWHITLTTSSGTMITLSTICGFLPQIVISLFAGVWIDRYNRKKMILLADAMIGISTAILAVLFLSGYKSTWLLFVILLIRSAGTGIQNPAVQSVIPQIVPKEHLMRVNGIYSSITSLMMFLSPAVSGAILSISTIEATLLIDVATAALGIGMMLPIPIAKSVVAPITDNSHLADIKAGFTYLKNNALIKNLLFYMITIAILISPSAFLTPLMVSRSFGVEMWRLTASEMTFSAGAVLGGVLIATWGGFRNRMHTTILAGLFYGTLMILLGVSPVFLLYLICNFLIGITMPCYNAPIHVMIQENVPPQMHGRVFSLLQISNSCSLPLGMLLFGPLADTFPVESLLIFSGSLVICCCLYTFFTKKLVFSAQS